ncbi:MAG: hypothetical protein U0L09_04645 [Christensenellales bacterium]|nr:hypothetical protein [Christensenellales bacterium]
MFIKQVSVFLENKPGMLGELTGLLGNNGHDIMAISIADTQSFGIIRMIFAEREIDGVLQLLRGAGYMAKVNNVICVVADDRPGGIHDLLVKIHDLKVSVEYLYTFIRPTKEKALVIIRLSEQENSVQRLAEQNIRIIRQFEVDQL